MFETDFHQKRRGHTAEPTPQDFLEAENESLRLLLVQAEINAQELLDQAGIDAKEREASDKLQKLILEELHHRIKNTLATVSAIASQSLRNVPGAEHAQHAIEGRLLALGRAHDLLLQARWTSADLGKVVRGATEAFDNPDRRTDYPDHLGRRNRDCNDAQRTLHQHHEVRRLISPDWPRRYRLDARHSEAARALNLDRKRRAPCRSSLATKLRDPPDRDARQAVEGRCSADLRAQRPCLRARCTASVLNVGCNCIAKRR
jgi:HWE histidine kinase